MGNDIPSGGHRDNPILHIRAQRTWHDDAYIIGNRRALLALRAAIDAALHDIVGFALVEDANHEGYVTAVFVNNASPDLGIGRPNPAWRIRMTHTEAHETGREVIYEPPPWRLLSAEEYERRRNDSLDRQVAEWLSDR